MVSEFWVYNGNLRGAVAVGYAVLGGGACASLTPAEGTVHPPVRTGRWHPSEGDCLWEERGGASVDVIVLRSLAVAQSKPYVVV